jgi:hypothetical protein
VAVILLVAAAGTVYFSRKIAPFLSRKLKEQVTLSSDSLYHIDFSSLTVNPFTGTIALQGFTLVPDTAVYSRLKAEGRAPENIFDLSVPGMELRHAHPIRLLLKRRVRVGDVRFEYPVVKILHEDLFSSDTAVSIQQSLAGLISGPLHAIRITRMDLDNMTISYQNKSHPASKGFFLQKADLILKDFYIDTSTIKDSTRFFYAKDLWLHLVNLKMPTSDSLYWLKLGDIVYSAAHRTGLIKELSLDPRYSEAAFDRKVRLQQDRYEITVDSVAFSGLNMIAILRDRRVGRIGRIDLKGADVDIYHNRALPINPAVKPLPQRRLDSTAHKLISKDIAAVFTVDTFSLEGADITYRELSPKSERIGTVSFQRLHGSFHHITNDAAALAADPHCTGDFSALFMGRGEAHVHFDFNLTAPDQAFSYSGSLGEMKTGVLNQATRYLALLKISSGNIHHIGFHFNANDYQARGAVTLLYDDLSVKLLTLDELSGRLRNKGLASLAVNLLVLRNNNTTDTAATRTAAVVYKRDPQKSMFNMMWKSLFEGVKEIVGMGESAKKLKKDWQQNALIKKITEKKNEKKDR